jgi:hypothetical protein
VPSDTAPTAFKVIPSIKASASVIRVFNPVKVEAVPGKVV